MRILIVGGGASGAAVAWNLASNAHKPIDLVIADPAPRLGRGVAYGVDETGLLLNVPAGRMGLSVKDSTHFCEWAQCEAESFQPRKIYGEYVEASLAEAVRKNRAVTFDHARVEITSIRRHEEQFVAVSASGDQLGVKAFDALVLALGNGQPNQPEFLERIRGSSSYVHDVWREDYSYQGSVIACVGTGLTFVDHALAILDANPNAKVLGFSRTGQLPETHLPKREPAFEVPPYATESVAGMVKFIDESGSAWRAAQDGIRHQLPTIWQGFSDEQKRIFLERQLRWWNVRRHRIAGSVDSKLQGYLANGQIELFAGEISNIRDGLDGFEIEILEPNSDKATKLRADQVLNCVGYELGVTNPLLSSMLSSGLVTPGPLGLGLAADFETLRLIDARGVVVSTMFGIGPLLLGERFETTAMPEIKGQAALIADQLIDA